MFGALRKEVGEILNKVCKMEEVIIIKAATLPDHVHMYVSIPPKVSKSKTIFLRAQLVQVMNKTANKRRKQSVAAGDPPDNLRQGLRNRVILNRDEQQDLSVLDLSCLRRDPVADAECPFPIAAGVKNLGKEQSGLQNADCLYRVRVDLIFLCKETHAPEPYPGSRVKRAYVLRCHVFSSLRAIRKARH